METIYENDEVLECFPHGSIIAGFAQYNNLGNIIAPTTPLREPRPVNNNRGSFHCTGHRSCLFHEEVLKETNEIRSPYSNKIHKIYKTIDCDTKFVVYAIYCRSCDMLYIGSTKDMKKRWTKHKNDMRKGNRTFCGLANHYWLYHQNNLGDFSCLEATLIDYVENERDLKRTEDKWICNLGTLFNAKGMNTRNEVLSNSRINNYVTD